MQLRQLLQYPWHQLEQGEDGRYLCHYVAFGYGKKTDLDFDKNPLHVVPPPNTYEIASFVETNKLHEKGFTPLFSRDVPSNPT